MAVMTDVLNILSLLIIVAATILFWVFVVKVIIDYAAYRFNKERGE